MGGGGGRNLAVVFERFTGRARRVLVLAQQEAADLGHGFIGTEHILLGLLAEHDGVAARALASLEVSLDAARAGVHDVIGLSALSPTGSPPFTPRAKKVLELSLREALEFGHNNIGTEHLLLGLVREGHGVAVQVLRTLGADTDRVRARVEEMLGDEPSGTPPPQAAGRSSRGGWSSRAPSGGMLRSCAVCERDLWEVSRFVRTAALAICADCVTGAAGALARGVPDEDGAISLPPRVSGTPPDGDAVDAIVAAFESTFGSRPAAEPGYECAEEIEGHLDQLLGRIPGHLRRCQVTRIRFVEDGDADVEFAFGPARAAMTTETGHAVRHGERWLVGRTSVIVALRHAGVVIPLDTPPPPGDGGN